MAGSSNRYGLGALMEGVGAGAAAYQPTKQAMLERERTKAGISGRQAQTLTSLGVTPGGGRFTLYGAPTPQGYVAFDNLKQKPLTRDEYEAVKNEAANYVFSDQNVPPGYGRPAGEVAGQITNQTPGMQPTAGKAPITFKAGANPDPKNVENEFGQASVLQALAGQVPTGTGKAVENWNERVAGVQKQAATDKMQMDNAVADFGPTYGTAMHNFETAGQYLKNNDLNRASSYFADIIGTMLSLPGVKNLVPDQFKEYQAATDYTKKAAVLQAMQQAGTTIGGAPASALAAALTTVADPQMAPSAKRQVMEQTMATLLMQKGLNDTYSKYRDQIYDVNKFTQKFYADNPLESFIPATDKMLGGTFAGEPKSRPVGGGVTPLTGGDISAMKAGTFPVGTVRLFQGTPHTWNGKVLVPSKGQP
jgi:hypothetical protein